MHNLETHAVITEAKATELIFDACRANPDRTPWANTEGYAVNFRPLSKGEYGAYVTNPFGFVVALAIVDEFDV